MSRLNRPTCRPVAGPSMRIERVPANTSWTVLCYSASIEQIMQHWNPRAGCSMPCVLPKEECDGCKLALPHRWKGFLFCHLYQKRADCFIELTPVLEDELKDQLGAKAILRGWRMELRRGGSKNAAIHLTVRERMSIPEGSEWPTPLSVEGTLNRLWELAGWTYHLESSANLANVIP